MKKSVDPRDLARWIEDLQSPSQRTRHKALLVLKRLTGKDLGPEAEPWRQWWKEYANLRCNRCGRALYDQKLYYLIKAQITSEPAELSLSEEELARDHSAEIGRLVEQLSRRPAQEAQDEVFVLLDYYLCQTCKQDYVRAVRKGPVTEVED